MGFNSAFQGLIQTLLTDTGLYKNADKKNLRINQFICPGKETTT